jgi:hypothetical protein
MVIERVSCIASIMVMEKGVYIDSIMIMEWLVYIASIMGMKMHLSTTFKTKFELLKGNNRIKLLKLKYLNLALL